MSRPACTASTYSREMARGWESKSVEAQQDEAKQKSEPRSPALTPRQAAMKRESESLKLARQRTLQQLESSSDPRLSAMLQSALADLDERIQALPK